ncbi:hypothetical protein BDR04DRAFT_1116716 [Suillus decipiens]|nr:hypothetical protein BDR04DRAFT_1116716 [Suillus decipiens]
MKRVERGDCVIIAARMPIPDSPDQFVKQLTTDDPNSRASMTLKMALPGEEKKIGEEKCASYVTQGMKANGRMCDDIQVFKAASKLIQRHGYPRGREGSSQLCDGKIINDRSQKERGYPTDTGPKKQESPQRHQIDKGLSSLASGMLELENGTVSSVYNMAGDDKERKVYEKRVGVTEIHMAHHICAALVDQIIASAALVETVISLF